MYKWLLLAHAMGGAAWFGSHVYLEALMANAARTKNPTILMTVVLRIAQVNQRIMAAIGVVTLVFGILLVIDGSYAFEDIFVTIGFAIAGVSIALGLFIFKPKGEEIAELVAENGLTDETAIEKAKSLGNLGHVQTLLITIAFVVMILKPGILI